MAKDARPTIRLKCVQCNSINYYTEKNVKTTKEALKLKKYCKKCKKRTEHRETK